MTNETKKDMRAWTQYFVIALIAEVGAGIALMPIEEGNDIGVYGFFQANVQPHLYIWFIIFMIISSIVFVKDGKVVFSSGIVLAENGDEGLQSRFFGLIEPQNKGIIWESCGKFKSVYWPVVIL